MDGWNTSFLLGRPIVRSYVSFREGICSPSISILHKDLQAENRRPGSVYKPEWIVDTMQSTWDLGLDCL